MLSLLFVKPEHRSNYATLVSLREKIFLFRKQMLYYSSSPSLRFSYPSYEIQSFVLRYT